MYDVCFDSGTTNTRMYLIAADGSVVFRSGKAVGSKDAAIADDRKLLARDLYGMFISMLAEMHLDAHAVAKYRHTISGSTGQAVRMDT